MKIPAGRPHFWRPWVWAAALELPVALVLAIHWLAPQMLPQAAGLHATGFLQYDQPYYMAIARSVFADGPSLLYGLPFSPNADTPRLYFQPLFVVLGLVQRLTGLSGGAVYSLATMGFGIGFFRVALALFERLFGLDGGARKLCAVFFCWGGGLLVLGGAVAGGGILRFDPAEGLWFLNLGRNAYYAVEAFYHLVVLATMLAVVDRRWRLAAVLLAVISVSHPFTGLQTLAAVGLWALIERLRHTGVPAWLPAVIAAMGAAHLGYYLLLLPTSPEHAALMTQWTLDWALEWPSILLAYGPVAALAALRLANRHSLADPTARLWLSWFAVSFALANHELFMTAHQPLHFTRGYVWTPLFLLAAPALIGMVERILALRPRLPRLALAGAVAVLALSDNAYWFGAIPARLPTTLPGLYLRAPEAELLSALNDDRWRHHLLVTPPDGMLGYWATVRSPVRAWHSHFYNTPSADRRREELARFYQSGAMPDDWQGRDLLVVVDRRRPVGRWVSALRPLSSHGPLMLLERSAAAH